MITGGVKTAPVLAMQLLCDLQPFTNIIEKNAALFSSIDLLDSKIIHSGGTMITMEDVILRLKRALFNMFNFRRDLTLHSAKLEIKRIFRESFRLTASRVARDKPWSTLCKKSHGIPSSPRAAAVAKFRLLTGHDCLCAHLFRFNLVASPICVLCDTGQDMTAAHLDECSALNDLNCIEDFGKRNMPGKRARRHFSQLSEFERGLIIGMKTAGWSTRRVAGQVDRSECAVRNCWEQWTREGTHVRKSRVWSDQEDHEERESKDRAASTCGSHSDSFNDTSRHWPKVVFSDDSRFVLGTDDNRVRVWRRPGPFINGLPGTIFQQDNGRPHTARVAQDFLRHFQTLPWPACSPDLSPVEHVWDQLKRQVPSCHSVHDLEWDVQDLWAHLPQDFLRCLINSMP
ncbi:transposable element Tcb2 transposase [Trichonephila clavipes]|nr:transposable element Tcb2 transposase [Trichonephila clavipes]